MIHKSLKDIENDFRLGKITKAEYIHKMHDIHSILFDYAQFIKNKDIKRIEIEDDSIIMISRENNIILSTDKFDERAIPLEILNFCFYEKNETDMILRIVKDCETILDIGANIGWYSINISNMNNKANIFAFEPIPNTFNYLMKNINQNNSSNIHAYNFGFSDVKKDLIFYYYKEGPGNSSIRNLSGRNDVKKILCKVEKMDDFVQEKDIIVDFIKCDVEGAELLVLKGGIETILRDKPIIFTELLRKWSRNFNYHPNEVIMLLKGIGYKCFTIQKEELKEFHEMDDNTVETNFLFLNPTKHNELIKNHAENFQNNSI